MGFSNQLSSGTLDLDRSAFAAPTPGLLEISRCRSCQDILLQHGLGIDWAQSLVNEIR